LNGKQVRIINKIYLSTRNTPNTHIDCVGVKTEKKKEGGMMNEYSFFPAE
jgi:hypothetical protein